jgi:hypothetical protein
MTVHQQISDTLSEVQAARCARGEHCANATTDDGATVAAWADLPSPFCDRDTGTIAHVLTGLPEWYVALHLNMGEKPRGHHDRVSGGSRTPPVPVRLDVDALIRDMVLILMSWDERIADAHQLTRPATWLSRYRRDQVTIVATVNALTPRLPDLLQLPAQAMIRMYSLSAAADLPKGATGRVHRSAGFAEVYADLDGAAAGLELLRLDYRCRRTLGHTLPPPIQLDGMPCKRCEMLALEVAPEPQYRSCCAECGDLLTAGEYREWACRYAAWARQQVEAGGLIPNDPPTFTKITGIRLPV